ncbi:hypothetical protein SUNI508_05059 [Seiridium unicorne]|uniref:Transmembrane protein n=1 Tax=Seiridium unicorne TaxID=138068 RepID=A0ABR2V695_9PEZI
MRSIPGFCLYDGIVDIIALVRAMRSEISEPVTDRHTGRRERPEHRIITMKLGIFAIAVLPQTFKVLSMRGIPVTQLCASAFFFATTTRLLIELGGWETDEYYPGATVVRVIGLLIYIGQAVLEPLIWYNTSLSALISMPPAMEYLSELLVDACNLMIVVQSVLSAVHIAVKRRLGSWIDIYLLRICVPWLLVVVLGVLKGALETVKSAEPPESQTRLKTGLGRINYVQSLVWCAALVSIVVVKGLDFLADLIAQRRVPPAIQGAGPDSTSTTIHISSSNQEEGPVSGQTSDLPDRSHFNQLVALLKALGHWIHTLGSCIDRWLMRFVSIRSDVSVAIAVTVFNLLTTVCYYLVNFDGTGTTSPAWTSMLG